MIGDGERLSRKASQKLDSLVLRIVVDAYWHISLAVLGAACCSLQALSSLRCPLTQAVVEAQATVDKASSGENCCGVVEGVLDSVDER